MLLFLSAPFLRRLDLMWKPDLTGFLVGVRNLFFFTPDIFIEAATIDPESIDGFYRSKNLQELELLGFLSPSELSGHPGFVEVNTSGSRDPQQWKAYVHLLAAEGPERKKLEIRVAGDSQK